MKLIDCIMYSGERDILSLRMDLMAPFVDKFLIIEAAMTFSGQPRELCFWKDSKAFEAHLHKVDYRTIADFPDCNSAWEREYFLRDSVRRLEAAEDNDTIIIADTDEILNLAHILSVIDRTQPIRIELPTYYYFLNVQSSEIINVTLIAPFSYIRDTPIGNRRKYKSLFPRLLDDHDGKNGGHFTYLFGKDIDKYINKLRSFSHTEYSGPHFTNRRRISTCIQYNLDLFEREKYSLRVVNLEITFPDLAIIASSRADLRHLIKPSAIHELPSYLEFMGAYLFRRILNRRRTTGRRTRQSRMPSGQP